MATTKKRSVQRIASAALTADSKARGKKSTLTKDSFVNFQQNLGIGADNPLTTSNYGFNPITRNRILLEWIHRGSWIGGLAVDVVAEDMTREGVEFKTKLSPEDEDVIAEEAVALDIWGALRNSIKWSRLYGGSIAVFLIEGQDMSTPLRIESVGKGQFRGLVCLDRWMVMPSLNDLVQDFGPNLGKPKFYVVNQSAPALMGEKIHYSRVIRFDGIELPWQQRITENLWSISILERIYDRMVGFDSATTGMAQLVYKAWIRTYKIKDLRTAIAAGGQAMMGVVAYVDMMRRFQGIEGVTLLDAEDEMDAMQHSAFTGLADVNLQLGQQLSGAIQVPLVRLFGQSPAGLNSTGESDLRIYQDGIKMQQEKDLKVGVTKVYRMMAQSKQVVLPTGFGLTFRSLYQLTDEQKASVANTGTSAIQTAEDAGLISQKTAMQELQRLSRTTGFFTNITDKDIADAEESLPPAGEAAVEQAEEFGLQVKGGEIKAEGEAKATGDKKITRDSLKAMIDMKKLHGLDVHIEHSKGMTRVGPTWSVQMPADYGYINRVPGNDGDDLDCYVGPNHDSRNVWIIDQLHLNSRDFDEHKCLLGYNTLREAMADYLQGYSDGRGYDRIGGVRAMNMDEFKSWIATLS